jgi:hypothetical protein
LVRGEEGVLGRFADLDAASGDDLNTYVTTVRRLTQGNHPLSLHLTGIPFKNRFNGWWVVKAIDA